MAVESKTAVRFTLGKQSSLAPERARDEALTEGEQGDVEGIDPRVRLMYLANEGDLEGLRELLDSGMDVNFRDIDNRTALHVAACQGFSDVVEFLLKNGAEIDLEDRWGSTVRLLLFALSILNCCDCDVFWFFCSLMNYECLFGYSPGIILL